MREEYLGELPAAFHVFRGEFIINGNNFIAKKHNLTTLL
jgi:hypothetical protein